MMTKIVWVARDKSYTDNYVYIWPENKKPERWKIDGSIEFNLEGDPVATEISVYLFKQLFGFTPKKNSCTKMRLITEATIVS